MTDKPPLSELLYRMQTAGLRDLFAGFALLGGIAGRNGVSFAEIDRINFARVSYEFADAMLKQREVK